MSDIKSKQLGAKVFLWTILFSTTSFVMHGLTEMATGPNSKILTNILFFALVPISTVYFAYFVAKNGDRAEYLIYGRLLSENKLKKE